MTYRRMDVSVADTLIVGAGDERADVQAYKPTNLEVSQEVLSEIS